MTAPLVVLRCKKCRKVLKTVDALPTDWKTETIDLRVCACRRVKPGRVFRSRTPIVLAGTLPVWAIRDELVSASTTGKTISVSVDVRPATDGLHWQLD